MYICLLQVWLSSQPPDFLPQTPVLCTVDLISSAPVTMCLSSSPQDMAMQPPAQMEGRCSACSTPFWASLLPWSCSRVLVSGSTPVSGACSTAWRSALAWGAPRFPWSTWWPLASYLAWALCVWERWPSLSLRDGVFFMLSTTVSSHSPPLASGTMWHCRMIKLYRTNKRTWPSASSTSWQAWLWSEPSSI